LRRAHKIASELINEDDVQKKKKVPFAIKMLGISKLIDGYLELTKEKQGEEVLRSIEDQIRTKLTRDLEIGAENALKKVYYDGMNDAEKQLGVNFTFDEVDKQSLNNLLNQKVLYDSFRGISTETSSKITKLLSDNLQSPKPLSRLAIHKEIKKISGLADGRAENIARTETAKAYAYARRNCYLKDDPQDQSDYLWIGPEDHRTTSTSKRIKRRVGKGVIWSELIKIIEEESMKDFPEWSVNKDFPVSHYQSRHTFIKKL